MTPTKQEVVTAINTLYDAGALNYQVLNSGVLSDIKDDDTKIYIRGKTVGSYHFTTRLGRLYDNMKNRCLIGGAVQRNQQYYFGATMSNEWAESFDNFASWAAAQIGLYQTDERGNVFELDADLFKTGSKHYSENTCTFLPKAINVALTSSDSRGYLVTSSGKYRAEMSMYGKTKRLGTYETAQDASIVYRDAKQAYLRQLANQYKHQISIKAYDALMSYKQK